MTGECSAHKPNCYTFLYKLGRLNEAGNMFKDNKRLYKVLPGVKYEGWILKPFSKWEDQQVRYSMLMDKAVEYDKKNESLMEN